MSPRAFGPEPPKKISKKSRGQSGKSPESLWKVSEECFFDTEYDRAKVPPYNGNDPPPESMKSFTLHFDYGTMQTNATHLIAPSLGRCGFPWKKSVYQVQASISQDPILDPADLIANSARNHASKSRSSSSRKASCTSSTTSTTSSTTTRV